MWHTRYKGSSFDTMQAEFGKNIANTLKKIPSVWSVDAEYQDTSGSATMTEKETAKVTKMLSDAGTIFQKLDASSLNGISDNEELLMRMKTFLNKKVRAGKRVTNVRKTVDDMITYFHDYYKIESDKRKSAKGKAGVTERKKEVMKYFSNTNRRNLENILNLMNAFVDIKMVLIKQMNKTDVKIGI